MLHMLRVRSGMPDLVGPFESPTTMMAWALDDPMRLDRVHSWHVVDVSPFDLGELLVVWGPDTAARAALEETATRESLDHRLRLRLDEVLHRAPAPPEAS